MIRKQGQWNPINKKKWCAECSTWIHSSQWKKHNENHMKTTSQNLKFPQAVTDSGLSNAAPAWPDWQKSYEEQTRKLHAAEIQLVQLRKMERENKIFKQTLAILGRMLVALYDIVEY